MIIPLGLLAVAALLGTTLFPKKEAAEGKDGGEDSDPPPVALTEGSLREQQLREVSAAEHDPAVSGLEQQADQKLLISTIGLGMAGVGYLAFPPLVLLSIPVTIYTFIPFAKSAYDDLKDCFTKKPRITMSIVDLVITTALMGAGHFFSGALITTLTWLSQKLLLKAEDHAQKSIINVFSEQPRSVWLVRDGIEVEIPFEQIKPRDILVIQAGELVPADGTIVQGNASIDQRILTGEAQPAEKGTGDTVFASTVVLSGMIHIQVDKAGQDTIAAQIGAVLNRSSAYAKQIDWEWKKFVDDLSPLCLIGGAITWPLLGTTAALGVMMSLSFGYCMRIIAPLTLLNFLSISSKKGVLVKDGRVLELLKQIDTVVFDKTGTLTKEIPTVSQIYASPGQDENELLLYAAAAEYKQTHPVALAILQEAQSRGFELPKISDAHYEVGYGITVQLLGKTIRVGSPRFMEMEGISTPAELVAIQKQSKEDGNTLICVAAGNTLAGMIELTATVRPEAKAVVADLKRRGLDVVVISGDHEHATKRLASSLGIEKYFAETLPENKSVLIEQLQRGGKRVCFVGDGINDSIALRQANVSVSLRGASAVAKDTASVILMEENLNLLLQLFDSAQEMSKKMRHGFVISTIPSVISLGGVIFLHLNVVVPILLYFTGMGLGVGNAVLPMLKPAEPTPKLLPAVHN